MNHVTPITIQRLALTSCTAAAKRRLALKIIKLGMGTQQAVAWALVAVFPFLALAASMSADREDLPPELRKVRVGDNVELHYVERGKGVAVIFVHGTLGDYSTWEGQLGPFAETYRAIAYSRRYNYPNANKLKHNHSAVVEAEDLAAFIKRLDRDAVKKISAATLLVCGERSPPSYKRIAEELERLLPEKGRQQVTIQGADHGMWFQQPAACRKAVLEFFRDK